MSLLLDNDFSYKIHQVKSTNKHKTTIILMQYRKKKKNTRRYSFKHY